MSSRESPTSLSIGELIDGQRIITHFQPIIAARRKVAIGVEALARGQLVDSVLTAATLFRMAHEAGLTASLERRCCEVAIRSFAHLVRARPELVLFLNLGSCVTSGRAAGVGELREFVESAELLPRRIAVEILETGAESPSQLLAIADDLRAYGFLVVLDDVGAGHSNLDRIALLKPDVVKVDRGLISGIDRDVVKQEAVKGLSGLGRRIGALLIAEGVETEDEAIVALEVGVDLLQGYFFAHANEHGALIRPDGTVADIELLAQHLRQYTVNKVKARRREHGQVAQVMDEVLRLLVQADVGHFESILRQTLREQTTVECVYVLDGRGRQVTPAVQVADVTNRPGILFQSGGRGADHSLKEYYYLPVDAGLPRYSTDPYVSLVSGNLCRTISASFRDARDNTYLLCIDVLCRERIDDAEMDKGQPSAKSRSRPDLVRDHV